MLVVQATAPTSAVVEKVEVSNEVKPNIVASNTGTDKPNNMLSALMDSITMQIKTRAQTQLDDYLPFITVTKLVTNLLSELKAEYVTGETIKDKIMKSKIKKAT